MMDRPQQPCPFTTMQSTLCLLTGDQTLPVLEPVTVSPADTTAYSSTAVLSTQFLGSFLGIVPGNREGS